MDATPELSIVVPMYNEAPGVHALVEALRQEVGAEVAGLEILCVDDGSSDRTAETVLGLSMGTTEVVLLQLSRRFGKESALWAGLCEARGRAVLFMDADLQHPPTLVRTMLQAWRDGADVVEGVKRSRGDEGALYRVAARLFNRVATASMQRSLEGASDFKLLDRQVVEALQQCQERHRFFRGLVAWVGFNVTQVPFDVGKRNSGASKWKLRQLFGFAMRSLLSFTAWPLHLVSGLGAVALLFSLVLGVQTLFRYLTGTALGGFTTVILLQLLLSGVLLASVGVIALYVAELYAEAKARPIYLVRKQRPPPGGSA